jgi:ATP-dependent helicase/DNAse subunit B
MYLRWVFVVQMSVSGLITCRVRMRAQGYGMCKRVWDSVYTCVGEATTIYCMCLRLSSQQKVTDTEISVAAQSVGFETNSSASTLLQLAKWGFKNFLCSTFQIIDSYS